MGRMAIIANETFIVRTMPIYYDDCWLLIVIIISNKYNNSRAGYVSGSIITDFIEVHLSRKQDKEKWRQFYFIQTFA